MAFHEKLQDLRKKKGLTQEELAKKLYVSRAAVSKWESGRGYPNIESLKMIGELFSVTVDELISGGEAITIAEADGREREARHFDLFCGLIDICMAMLIFLPFFGEKTDSAVISVSLIALSRVSSYLKVIYFSLIALSVTVGALLLSLKNCRLVIWMRVKAPASFIVGAMLSLVFILSSQPYAGAFAFVMLVFKAVMLIKRR
jgi:transcriptional regulator with XRE-family HTH domain